MRTGKTGRKRANRGDVQTLVGALRVIAAVLEGPRDRLGRLDRTATDESRDANETLRLLAVAYSVGGCTDAIDQCAKVARAAIEMAAP